MSPSMKNYCKLSFATVALIATVTRPASAQAQPPLEISVQASTQQELAASGEWNKISDDVWQRDIDGVQAELAFGTAALERSLDHVESEIRHFSDPQSRQQKLDLMELELRRDELIAAARQMLSTKNGSQTSNQRVCAGTARFTHWYGQTWFFTHTVRSKSSYGEPGPISPYTKTAYARAKACTTTSPIYCDAPAPASASSGSWAVGAEVEASRYPVTGAAREAYGYVLVFGACTQVVSFSTSVPN